MDDSFIIRGVDYSDLLKSEEKRQIEQLKNELLAKRKPEEEGGEEGGCSMLESES